MTLREHRLAPSSGGSPSSVVLFLHGLGDSGSGGLLDICRLWQRGLPETEFICPDAPFEFDMAPPDFGGRQWFSLQEFTQAAMDEGVKSAAPILNEYIDEVLATRKVKPARLVVAGFSQGTMMALYIGLRRMDVVAGILGYSGLLTNVDSLGKEKAKITPPVLLVHGTGDDVVPFSAMEHAEQNLRAVGVNVETLICPVLGHGVDDAGIAAGFSFLQRILSPLDN